jgi:aspartyl-tRNA(Asn)/glutamyl-tRNA(Gln) amidotransferase subunit A
MTRTVADAALMLDVIGVPDERDRLALPAETTTFSQALLNPPRELRIGWSPDLGYAAVDQQVRTVVEKAVQAFTEAFAKNGWSVEEAHPGFADPIEIFNTIVRAENFVFAGALLEKHADLLDPGMRKFAQLGAEITAWAYLQATQARDKLCENLATFFQSYDLLVTPTVAVPPFAINTRPKEIDGRETHVLGWLPFTYPFNLTGNPAASLPCGWTEDGLPMGMQIVGRRFADALVLQASAVFEELRPWVRRRLL